MSAFEELHSIPMESWRPANGWITPAYGTAQLLPDPPAVPPLHREPFSAPLPAGHAEVHTHREWYGVEPDDPWGFRGPIFGR